MEQNNTPVSEQEEQQKREERRKRRIRILAVILHILLLLLLLSTCGMHLFRKTAGDRATGKVSVPIEIIFRGEEKKNLLHFAGIVRYTDGTPVPYKTVELHSEVRTRVTDKDGYFLFENTEEGWHTVSVLDENGNVLAQKRMEISRENCDSVTCITDADGNLNLIITLDLRLVEIVILLDREGGMSLSVGNFTWLTKDGEIHTPSGTASVEDGTVITPKKHVCIEDGTVFVPAIIDDKRWIITPEDELVALEPGEYDGYTVTDDGTVRLEDGTVILPDGGIILPDGSIADPGDSGLIVYGDGDTEPIGYRKPTVAPTAQPTGTVTPTPTATATPEPTATTTPTPTATTTPKPTATTTPKPTATTTPKPTATTTPKPTATATPEPTATTTPTPTATATPKPTEEPSEVTAELVAMSAKKGSESGDEVIKSSDKPFVATCMYPGDSLTEYYCLRVKSTEAAKLRFYACPQDKTAKLGEVLKIKVTLWTADKNGKYTISEALYDGLMRDMEKTVKADTYKHFAAVGATQTEYFYEVTVYLDTSVGNEYMNLTLKADFCWEILG